MTPYPRAEGTDERAKARGGSVWPDRLLGCADEAELQVADSGGTLFAFEGTAE